MFNLNEHLSLLELPGVNDHLFVQCPFGSYSVKPTRFRFYLAAISPSSFPSSCPRSPRRWKYEDGEILVARHPPLTDKRRAVLEELWVPGAEVSIRPVYIQAGRCLHP